jgi:hypothetical protein
MEEGRAMHGNDGGWVEGMSGLLGRQTGGVEAGGEDGAGHMGDGLRCRGRLVRLLDSAEACYETCVLLV